MKNINLDKLAGIRSKAQKEFYNYDKALSQLSDQDKMNDPQYIALRNAYHQAQSTFIKAYDKVHNIQSPFTSML